MPRPADPDAAREKAFNDLPLSARTDVAQARNMRARVVAKREEMLEQSRLFKAMVHRLHKQHKLSTNKIALLLGVTWDWIDDILNGR